MGQGWIAAEPCRLTGAVRRCWAQSDACVQRHMPASTLKPYRHAARDCSQLRLYSGHGTVIAVQCLQDRPQAQQMTLCLQMRTNFDCIAALCGNVRTSAANADCMPDLRPCEASPLRGDACSEREAACAAWSRSSCWHRLHMKCSMLYRYRFGCCAIWSLRHEM